MDRTTRFQNPIPLSSGGFNKPPPIQNDGAGMKPLSPSILDRFRAMVKEREEELKAFGDGVVLPMSTDEIVRLYEIVLSELTINSKPIITDLTIIAGEQRAHGEGIANAICARIIEVLVDQKLPSLYLLDSIVKNIGKEYIKYFSALLPEVFCEAYAQVQPNMHPAMRHLFGTWSAVFPLPVLENIEAQLRFSPSANVQSSGLSSSRASESPRPTHGIHINPKYLEAQRPFRHSTIDAVGTEGLSAVGPAGLATSSVDAVKKPLSSAPRITRSSHKVGHVGSLSPLVDDFGMDSSPKRVAIRASPSRPGIDYGLSRVMGREKETSEWRKRNWQGNSIQRPKTSVAYKYGNGVDLSGPRALISAYGMDDREKNLNHKHQLDLKIADRKVAIRTWQNTEEEEFDWEDMNPALADRRLPKEPYSSFPGNSMARHSFTKNHTSPLITDYRGNLSKAQLSSAPNSSNIEDVSHISPGRGLINNIRGVLPNLGGPSDLPSWIPRTFAQESLILPHQQSQIPLNAKADRDFSGPSSVVSNLISAHDSSAPDIQSVNDVTVAKSWHPAKSQSSHVLPSLSALPRKMQIRGQFGMKNVANIGVDQGMNKIPHTEQHFGDARSMSLVNFPQIPSQCSGMIPTSLQSTAQASQVQPNMLMAQGARQNLPLPRSAPTPSNAVVQPFSYGYLSQAQGPLIGTASSNLLPGVQSSMPVLNAPNVPFTAPGAARPSVPTGPLPGITQALPFGQNIGQVAPNAPAGGALSGLITSLMAQGLLSVTKEDSVGVEFDQDSLKVRHESVITALYADLPRQCTTCGLRFKSQEEHSNHMDWHVNKNRTLKNRKTKPSPKWFVSISMWLSGAEAVGNEAVPGFLPAENIVENKGDEEMAVPADEEQNACALCGEPFEDFYSDEMEEWMYKGAVYMYAPAGSTAGLDRSLLGPIVHAKCRSDSHGIPSEDFEKDEGESTSRRKRMRS